MNYKLKDVPDEIIEEAVDTKYEGRGTDRIKITAYTRSKRVFSARKSTIPDKVRSFLSSGDTKDKYPFIFWLDNFFIESCCLLI